MATIVGVDVIGKGSIVFQINERIMKQIFLLTLILFASAVNANVRCSDVAYGSKNYHQKMEELVKDANLKREYYTRYDQSAVSALCKGDEKELNEMIDYGFIKKSEVESLREVLSLEKRTSAGRTYSNSRRMFEDMGLCSACADNVAQHYTKTPNSKCGKLAKQSLEGDKNSIRTLQEFPDYCQWKY